MKVILVKDVNRLGKEGSEVEAKNGYARNFLIPRGYAVMACPENLKKIGELKRQRVKQEEKERVVFVELKSKIEAISLTISAEAKGEEELYGSVTNIQIAKALKSEGISIDKEAIVIDTPIKKLGAYNLTVNLHPQVQATLRIWIVKK
jgi:large subunit ribosomal protein L9